MQKQYKTIEPWQGTIIKKHHLKLTPKEIAEKVPMDEIKVRLYMQAEGLEMKSKRKTKRRRFKNNYL